MAATPAAEAKRPIIIKKRKIIAAGHHGGAWKVAYADFVTAMMAFFMVMWLVASVSKEQRAAIFEYFKNPSMEQGKSPKPAPGQNGPGGASTSVINLRGGLDAPRSGKTMPGIGEKGRPPPKQENPTEERALQIAEAAEKRHLEQLMQELKDAINQSKALQPFKDQMLLDITPEGLRIQIVDAQNRAMFDSGSAKLKDYTQKILVELAPYLQSVNNRLSISGHTDVTPYGTSATYTNWELSADRANAARRSLQVGGLSPDKIARVVGLSSSVLFNKAAPQAPINRRVSIIVMTRRAEESALRTDSPDQANGAAGAGAKGGLVGATGAADAEGSAASPSALSAPGAPAASAPGTSAPGVKLPPLPFPAGSTRPIAPRAAPARGAAAPATVTS